MSVCWQSYRIPEEMESQSLLTMDCDGFSVLQNSIPRRDLHSDCTNAFPGERACHTSLQGDYWLLGEKDREREGREEGESQSHGALVRDPYHTAVFFTLQRCQTHSKTHRNTHMQEHTLRDATICAGLHTVSGPTESSLCDSGSSFLLLLVSICSSNSYEMLRLPQFITNCHNWLSLRKAPVGAE